MLDLDAQEDDVSGAAQDRTAEFAAQSSSAPADFRTAERSEQERPNETDYMARRSSCLGPWAPSVRSVPRTDLPVFGEGVWQTRRPACTGWGEVDFTHNPSLV